MADPFSLENPFPCVLTDGFGKRVGLYLGRSTDLLNASFAQPVPRA
jgi:hypothetical protein